MYKPGQTSRVNTIGTSGKTTGLKDLSVPSFMERLGRDRENNHFSLPQAGVQLIHRLEKGGHEGFFVGGCVRDILMGKEPKDWDICTDATPEEMRNCLQTCKVVETGLRHGTLTVSLNHEAFEVTTYRIDGAYGDHRRPDAVEFTRNIVLDLARRDFTINAMAYHPERGLVDVFGGRSDLEAGILRCVGKPQLRFEEDALRILRALRFASRLGFSMEETTAQALLAARGLLADIAAERIRMELEGLLCGMDAAQVCRDYRQVLAEILPEIVPMFDLDQATPYHLYDVWEHTLRVMEHVSPVPVLRLAAFFHDMGKPACKVIGEEGRGHFYGHEGVGEEMARLCLRRLKYDNVTRNRVVKLIHYHGLVLQPTEKYARRRLRDLGAEDLRLLIELELADVKSQHPDYVAERVEVIEAFRRTMEGVLEKEQCFSMKDLAVDGRDLLRQGVPQGREIGRILKMLLEGVVEGTLENKREVLLKIAEDQARR